MQEDKANGKPRVLVIASQAEFLEKAEKALGDAYQVTATADAAEGLKGARNDRPDAIVLGHLEPRGSVFNVHGELRGGWLTRNTPLIAIDFGDAGANGWRQEDGVAAGDDAYLAVSTSGTIAVSTVKPSSLAKAVGDCLAARSNSFRTALLDADTFCVTWEQIPGRGAFEKSQADSISNARRAARGGKIHGISITDNPGGNPAYATEMLGTEIKKLGIEPLVHLACRDKNRNEIESLLHGLTGSDVRNVLVLTGDYPSNEGFGGGTSKPVFDVDAVQALQLIDTLNHGLPHQVSKNKAALTATDFFAGACVSPFKTTEAELMGQYYKLAKKIMAGAAFIISQVGYDARKLHEIMQWLKANSHDLPVIANIYVLPLGAARAMNRNGIPGCVVTDKLVGDIAPEAKEEDKGKGGRLLRAAKMYAIAKGMGCAGAHIGGHNLPYDQVEFIIDKGEELSANWHELLPEFDYPQTNGFYLFERDPAAGLNSARVTPRPRRPGSPLIYRFSRLMHSLMFSNTSPIFKMLRPVARFVDSRRGLTRVFSYGEHGAKVALYACQNCGDCGLTDVAYLCPTSQCPKNQRNAPCGGSYEGWCEVYPNEKKCIWVRAYGRLKHYGEEEQIGKRIVPPNDWGLWETSSWLNFYLGRDHTAKRIGIKPPEKKDAIAEA